MNENEQKSAISVKNVTKSFGRKLALDNVSLTVPQGTVFALLGENGAGKTTLLRSILGLQKPDQGDIDVLGLNPAREGLQLRRQLGYVADQPALYDWMTVSEIGWFASGFYSPGFLDQYQALTQKFDLESGTKIKNMSRGMKAKVNLALAMSHQPELLIMDEPTSGLDTVVRRRFLESMIDIAEEGRTVLLASHQIPEVERVADIVAIVHNGKLQLVESLESLKARMEWWTVRLRHDQPTLPELGLKTLLTEGRNRMFKILVDSATTDQLCQTRQHEAIESVEVDVPSLEEIFVASISNQPDHPDYPPSVKTPSKETVEETR
jgi:ABC-2 type transport system ATP-binding protein